jgi:hypothetical protein
MSARFSSIAFICPILSTQMKSLLVAAVGLAGIASASSSNTVSVDATRVVATTNSQYVGYNLGGEWNSEHFDALEVLTQGLGSTIVRIGGTFGDYQIYDVGADKGKYSCDSLPDPMTDYLCKQVSESSFEKLFAFGKKNNVNFVFGLNDFFGRPPKADGEPNICSTSSCPDWDSSNTRALLQWIHDEKYPVYAFELGNELNKALRGQAGAKAQAQDLKTLKKLVDSIWSSGEDRPLVFGPDSHSWIMFNNKDESSDPHNWQAMLWFQELIKDACGSIDGVTYHMYLAGPTSADVSNFTTPHFLDRSHTGASKIVDTVRSQCPDLLPHIWAGETASANQGGIEGASDRFADVFWYADQLGTLAKLGHSGFMRQKLVGGGTKYGLVQLEGDSATPNPDYYVAVLYGQLMSKNVLNVEVTGSDSENLRAYAHCTANANNEVSLVLLNLSTGKRIVKLSGSVSSSQNRKEWHLTNTISGLTGYDVELNGKQLKFDGTALPNLAGKSSSSSTITLEPQSVTFVTVPASSSSVCAQAATL